MIIGIDYTAALSQSAGIGRSVRELTAALVSGYPQAEWRLFAAGVRGPIPAGAVLHRSLLSERSHNRIWQRLRLPVPVELWTGPQDLYHAPDFSLPPSRAASVLTVHDLAFVHHPAETLPGMLHYLNAVVPRGVARAAHVITPSESARQDVIARYGAPPQKVSAVAHGVEPRFTPEGPLYDLPPGDPVVLRVGTLQPRKNHSTLVRAMAAVPGARLVIAGGRGWAYDAVRAEIERAGLACRVSLIGYVPDADLPSLYRCADVFVYPALYEGFGLPVLEAMASGTPVIAADRASLPEVVGEAGLLVDPLDAAARAAAIRRVLADRALADRLRAAGIERAAGFTWGKAAAAVWTIYQHVLG
ncbi:MAG: glycosyltransferase family 4 protein [Anaerolineae bacterium]